MPMKEEAVHHSRVRVEPEEEQLVAPLLEVTEVEFEFFELAAPGVIFR